MQSVEVHYYDRPGSENTDDVLRVAAVRAQQLGIRQVVVASSHGATALAARDAFPANVSIVAVGISAAFAPEGWVMTEEERRRVTAAGMPVLTAQHALGDDVSEAMAGDGWSPNRIVRETLYRFSQGMKVAVEVSLMAADAGLIDMEADVIAIAGTDGGADTAIVLKPVYARHIRQLKIREILAMPRG
ncbi:MAG: pyruvate kinase alpha/beta domain-containing protein [Anaerolineae bacterium]